MKFGEISIKDKLRRTVILRSARPEDSTALIKYLRIISAETPYLVREPEEITITEEKEKQFIQAKIDAERELTPYHITYRYAKNWTEMKYAEIPADQWSDNRLE